MQMILFPLSDLYKKTSEKNFYFCSFQSRPQWKEKLSCLCADVNTSTKHRNVCCFPWKRPLLLFASGNTNEAWESSSVMTKYIIWQLYVLVYNFYFKITLLSSEDFVISKQPSVDMDKPKLITWLQICFWEG